MKTRRTAAELLLGLSKHIESAQNLDVGYCCTDPHPHERVIVRNSVHTTISEQMAALYCCNVSKCFDESCIIVVGAPYCCNCCVVEPVHRRDTYYSIPLYAAWGTVEI